MVNKEFTYPVYRIGRICRAGKKLPFDKSEKLVKLLQNKTDQVSTFIENELKQAGAQDFDYEGREIRIIDKVTPTITFPAFKFKLSDYSMRCRNSFTVGYFERALQVWSRFSLTEISDKPAVNLDYTDVDRFFKNTKNTGRKLNDSLISLYDDIMDEAGITSPLKKTYTFDIYAVNSSNENLPKFFEYLIEEPDITLLTLAKKRNFRRPITDFLRFLTRNGDKGPESMLPRIKKRGVKLIGMTGFDSYEKDALYAVNSKLEGTSMFGLNYDSKKVEEGPSNATLSSRAILRTFARKY